MRFWAILGGFWWYFGAPNREKSPPGRHPKIHRFLVPVFYDFWSILEPKRGFISWRFGYFFGFGALSGPLGSPGGVPVAICDDFWYFLMICCVFALMIGDYHAVFFTVKSKNTWFPLIFRTEFFQQTHEITSFSRRIFHSKMKKTHDFPLFSAPNSFKRPLLLISLHDVFFTVK